MLHLVVRQMEPAPVSRAAGAPKYIFYIIKNYEKTLAAIASGHRPPALSENPFGTGRPDPFTPAPPRRVHLVCSIGLT